MKLEMWRVRDEDIHKYSYSYGGNPLGDITLYNVADSEVFDCTDESGFFEWRYITDCNYLDLIEHSEYHGSCKNVEDYNRIISKIKNTIKTIVD